MMNSPVDLSSLPDDLLLNCLARVSRLYYPILSLVSKRFSSLVASPELYKIRKLLGQTESCLYVCLESMSGFDRHWFRLLEFDPGFRSQNPNMGVLAIDGKLYLFGDKNLVYKPKEKTWDVVGFEINFHWIPHDSFCVIDKVIIYYYNRHSRLLEWYDPEGSSWGILNGLEELLPKLPRVLVSRHVRLVDYGGKVAIFWEKEVRPLIGYNKITIWCAEIALERRNAQEIYGKIEWCNVVLTLPSSCSIDELNAVSIIV
ncbi:putative F-box domain, kelch-type beta propeller, F-box-like domain superfamily [Arabidopsis thaliana]